MDRPGTQARSSFHLLTLFRIRLLLYKLRAYIRLFMHCVEEDATDEVLKTLFYRANDTDHQQCRLLNLH